MSDSSLVLDHRRVGGAEARRPLRQPGRVPAMATSRAHSEVLNGGAERRRYVAVLAAGLLASGSFVMAAALGGGSTVEVVSVCGPGGELVQGLPGPIACLHEDVAPPGVDVTDHVSSRELRSRGGAGPSAYEAAEELGLPTAAQANATTPAVP